MPSAPRNGEARTAVTIETGVAEPCRHLAEDGALDLGITHDAAAADSAAAGLELRLDEQDELGALGR